MTKIGARQDQHLRFTVLALISNALLWGQAQSMQDGRLLLVIPYFAGFLLGWTVHPAFVARRDKWSKSAYERGTLRILRAITYGASTAVLARIIWMASSK
jgi:hypothetical protein